MATPLSARRPMWQFHLVDDHRGGCALDRAHPPLLRRRHRARPRDAVDDRRRAPTGRRRCRSTRRSAASSRRRRSRCADCSAPLTGVVKSARKIGAHADRKGAAILADPAQAVALADAGRRAHRRDREARAMPQDSPTRFKGSRASTKRVAWAEPLPLDDVKTIGTRARRVDQRRAAVVRRGRAARLSRRARATTSTA